jgi:hypothetical protein
MRRNIIIASVSPKQVTPPYTLDVPDHGALVDMLAHPERQAPLQTDRSPAHVDTRRGRTRTKDRGQFLHLMTPGDGLNPCKREWTSSLSISLMLVRTPILLAVGF